MKHISLIIIFHLCLLYALKCPAQYIYGAKSQALADANVAIKDTWANTYNAAGIAFLNKIHTAASYQNKFGVEGLNNKAIVFTIPVKQYVLGSSIQSYGTNFFKQNKVSFSLAKAFGNKLSTAITLNYHEINIDNYGKAEAFTAEIGIQYHYSENLTLGAHISNPNQSNYIKQKIEKLPSHIKFGANYSFSEKIRAVSEIEKTNIYPLDFKFGIDYQIADILSLKGGFSANSFKQYGGFGLFYKKIAVDIAISSHPDLGYSPQFSCGYEF